MAFTSMTSKSVSNIGRSAAAAAAPPHTLIPSRILTFFHEGFLWLQQLFRAATIDLDLMRKIIDFYQVKDEVFQGNFFIFPLSSSSYHLTFKSCCCCLSVDKVVSVLKKNDAQWAKMWKKFQFQMCVWEVARLPQRQKLIFFEKNFLHSRDPPPTW